MGWKSKDKELTRDEAIELARKELRPFWINSVPLLAAGPRPDGSIAAFPIDDEFAKKSWLILFVDVTTISGASSLPLIDTWYRRYRHNGLTFLVVFRIRFEYLLSEKTKSVPKILKEYKLECPVFLDTENLLARAFSATQMPAAVVMGGSGPKAFEGRGHGWFTDLEKQLQHFLRTKDPGLPLVAPIDGFEGQGTELAAPDLGRGRGTVLEGPNFILGPDGIGHAHFNPPASPPKPGQVQLMGSWTQDGESISPIEPESKIRFHAPSSRIGIVARCLGKSIEHCRVLFDWNGETIPDTMASQELSYDEEGRAMLRIEGPRLYRISDRAGEGGVLTVSFANADKVPIAIYGLRSAE